MSASFLISSVDPTRLIQRYQARRHVFLKALSAPLLLNGLDALPEQQVTPWDLLGRRWEQSPLLLHLTGINQLGIALFLDPKNAGTSLLFLPRYDKQKARWDGDSLCYKDDEQARALALDYGFSHIYSQDSMRSIVAEYLQDAHCKELNLLWHFSTSHPQKIMKDHHYTAKQALSRYFKRKGLHLRYSSIQDLEWEHRLLFDDIDLSLAIKAQEKTALCFEECIKQLPYHKNEQGIAGVLNGALEQQSFMGKSFPSIVACGDHACTLHYHKNNAPLSKDRLLLLDFGLRYFDIVTDISRTIPVNGRFNPLQRCLYELVLQTQTYVASLVKPGALLRDINQACWLYLNRHLDSLMTRYQGTYQLDYEHAPHNVSHLIKTAVHDGDYWRDYANRPLRIGECISNEPGLYGNFDMVIDGQRYHERIGIRIEDNLLVTSNGCRNLSVAIPKTIRDLEALFDRSSLC
ncbi:MAG: aminopeptidase P N-terminal domain-containing protein [bacterium]